MALHNNPRGMMQSSESSLWKQFQCLKMKNKKKNKNQNKNKNVYKSKKAPPSGRGLIITDVAFYHHIISATNGHEPIRLGGGLLIKINKNKQEKLPGSSQTFPAQQVLTVEPEKLSALACIVSSSWQVL